MTTAGRIPGSGARLLALPILLASCWLLTGCSTYADRNARLRDDLATGRFDEALTAVADAERGSDRLLNLLERGLVLHYADRWVESNEVFEEAERLSDDLYTRSVSQAVVSIVSNDGVIDYRAAPFEMALVPYFRALNYVYLGQRDEAVVEARKAELRLRDLADVERAMREENEEEDDADPPAVSLDDHAFIHYLRGMLHEWGGETNEAFIAYRRAVVGYAAQVGPLAVTMPPWLGEDLLRTGRRLGFRDEIDELRKVYPDLIPDTPPAVGPGDESGEPGRVVLFLETGWTPHRVSVAADIPIFENDDHDDVDAWAYTLRGRYYHGYRRNVKIDSWIRFALPELVDEPSYVVGARVSTGTLGGHALTVPVEDVAGRSRAHFDGAMGGIVLKTIARAVAKYLASQAVGERNQVAGFLANLLGVASEQADTRNWLTLPRGVAMARIELPSGLHDLRVDLVDADGRVVGTETVERVNVRSGDWTFVSRRVF